MSTNVHDLDAVPLREIVVYVAERAEIAEAERADRPRLRAAFEESFPEDVPLRGFDLERHILEDALAALE